MELQLTAAACLSDNVRYFYDDGQKIADSDKNFLKEHIIDCITLHQLNKSMADTFAQILEKIVTSDFPSRWSNLPSMTLAKLNSCNQVEELFGSLITVNILIKSITLNANQNKDAIEEFVARIFPMLEILVQNQINGWNDHTPKILYLSLKCFLHVVTIEIPEYLNTNQNSNSFSMWMHAIQFVLDRRLPESLTSSLQSWKDQLEREKNIEWKLKRVCVQILNW